MTEYAGNAGDGHIWVGNTYPPEAVCGYVPEVTEHEAVTNEEGATVEAWLEIHHADPTGVDCDLCRDATA
jgi:hypothetical protein